MRNLRRFAILLSFLLVVLAGCAPATRLNPKDIDFELKPGAICTTIEALQAEKDKAFTAGQLAGCKADVVLMNPTYAQLQKFLIDNKNLTMCEGHNCVDFTFNLAECAYDNGWEMFVVLLNFKETGSGHVLGAFQTTDKGMVFIESQTLWVVKVELGYDYALNYTSRNWSFGAKDGVQPAYTIKQIGIFR